MAASAPTLPFNRAFEPAGRMFFSTRLASVDVPQNTSADNADAAANVADDDGELMTQDRIDELVEARDFYGLLGLESMDASPELIRTQYRKMLLRYHPDKTGVSDDDPHFLMIQEAYDTLSDEEKRRGFDSQYEFDESFPSGKNSGGENFFKAWGPVFKRNGRFSVITPVPELGDIDSPAEHVNAFWGFWRSFKSWRDFSSQDEHQINAGDSREDKRWMMQENQQQRRKLKKKEMKRISEFVELAFRLDPRRKRIAEEAAAAKAAAKNAKRNKAMSAAAAKKAKEEEEKAAKEAAIKAEREAKKAAKAARKELNRKKREVRLQLQEVCGAMDTLLQFTEEDYLALANGLDLDALTALLAEVKQSGNPTALSVQMAAVKGEVQAEMEAKAQEREATRRAAIKKAEEAEAAKASKPWTLEEESWLAKGMVKYPAGTRKRWEEVANYMAQVGKCELRRGKECVSHAELMKKNELLQRASKASATAAAASASAGSNVNAIEAAKATAAKSDDPASWSQEEQEALEAAMVEFPASMDKKERWRSIAGKVPGRGVKACVARVKYLRSMLSK